jgi:hypothetical protein
MTLGAARRDDPCILYIPVPEGFFGAGKVADVDPVDVGGFNRGG